MFKRLFGRDSANSAIVDALYDTIVAAARQPKIYSDIGVPDTPLGRFEMMSLHLFLLLRRLRNGGSAAAEITQQLVDRFFMDVDHSLRELGIGDTSVPKRARNLARMFYGRISAYDPFVDTGDAAGLAAAMSRNIRPDLAEWPGATDLASYVLDAANALASQPTDRILAGSVQFPDAGGARSDAA